HQHRVLERILEHLRGFGVVLRQHLQLLAAGQRAAVAAGPGFRRRRDHLLPPSGANSPEPPPDLPPGWAPPLPATWPELKMYLPKSCSMLIDPWVMVIVWPGCNIAASPPGLRATYLPPSRLSLVISAELSF